MCGLTGFWDRSASTSGDELERLAVAMRETLVRRGPDDAGVWVDPASGVAFGFRRLSIVDLSPTGHQPMISADGRFVIAFNGEIYNFRELRAELEAVGIRFRGTSDTEVMVEGFSHWGVRPTLERLIGMFAVALFDRRTRSLQLIRDRLGIKPLYWARFGQLILFGSELKALRMHPGWNPEVDQNAASAFLRFAYVPAPYTIYKSVRKLEPGTMLTVDSAGEPRIERFWDLRDVAREGQSMPSDANDEEAVDALDRLLKDAVGRRMIADVPLGAFLSGGIDSSTVVALMQAKSDRPVRTFTIGFHETGYDEAEDARKVARHLGTDHTELYVEPAHARDVIPNLPEHYDEPFADSSQIPTLLISELTRRHVTVALSGDGGDEVFAGYHRYRWADAIWRRIGWMPRALRRAAASGLRALPPQGWDCLFAAVPDKLRPRQAGDKVHKIASILGSDSADSIYRRLITQWDAPERLMPGAVEPLGLPFDPTVPKLVPDFFARMRFVDTLTYLPDDILTKLDRASMAASLEARVPLLDHRVVSFAWHLPRRFLVRGATSKWLLRQVLYRYVPRELVERPKTGFGVPIDAWLRGPLRDWAESLLAEPQLREAGLEPGLVRARWQEHLSGRRNWQYSLWTILMLQAWRRRWSAIQPHHS
jgi:asparagine synthase (glutamine-hydrolysing)